MQIPILFAPNPYIYELNGWISPIGDTLIYPKSEPNMFMNRGVTVTILQMQNHTFSINISQSSFTSVV